MLELGALPSIYSSFRARWSDRDNRMLVMQSAVDGSLFTTTTPDDEDHENVAPNMLHVALEDTAESAALMPTVRAPYSGPDSKKKQTASKMERIGTGYIDRAGGYLFLIKCLMDLIAYGFCVATESLDDETGVTRLDYRDAVGCYPEPGWKSGDSVRRCLFAREVYRSQLPANYRAKLDEAESLNELLKRQTTKVILCEWYDEDEIVIAVLYTGQYISSSFNSADALPVLLERYEHKLGYCPVQLGQRISLDHEPRGQFDQIVDPMIAHARLMAMAIDYADQAVYSDMWVKDLVGPLPTGGGGVIQLGPNGAIGRVPPAVTSLSLFNELDRLMDGIHLGGRWPKARPGEIDQSQASAKFLETSVGLMNTAIRTLHEIMARFLGQALHGCMKLDKKFGTETATTQGVLRNQEFTEEYNPREDIDLTIPVTINYGLGLGRDPAQSAVIQAQYLQIGLISKQTARESIDGLTDVEKEAQRTDVEKMTDMLMAKLMQSVEQGQVPDSVLFNIIKDRQDGKPLLDILKKQLIDPQDQAKQTGIMSGLTGALQQPGMPPPPPGGGGPQPPAAPDAVSMIGQLSTPAGGPGSFLGSRVQSGG